MNFYFTWIFNVFVYDLLEEATYEDIPTDLLRGSFDREYNGSKIVLR